MIGIFQGSPEGRANEGKRRAKGGLPRATSKKQGKRRAWEGALPKAGQFGSYGCRPVGRYPLQIKQINYSPFGCSIVGHHPL